MAGTRCPDPEEGRLIVIFKITRFYKQKNESFRYKITKSEWAGLIVEPLCYCRAREAMAVPIMEKAAPMRTTQPKTSFPGSDASAMTK